MWEKEWIFDERETFYESERVEIKRVKNYLQNQGTVAFCIFFNSITRSEYFFVIFRYNTNYDNNQVLVPKLDIVLANLTKKRV